VVEAGFPVVATSSAAVAASLGYEDHQGAPPAEMLAAAARIARSVDVPVTVDAEGGYGLKPDDLIGALLDAGASGCNLEDTDHATGRLTDPERHAPWLATVRQAASRHGYGLVINARVDVFLVDQGRPQAELLDEAVARGRAYLEAGADCVFPIFLGDPEVISGFLGAVGGPVNILAMPQAPPISLLAEMGVARISYGSLLHRRTLEELGRILAELRQ
jgi:2-methylisocitrate lyase-like PEP mutase family enzyme